MAHKNLQIRYAILVGLVSVLGTSSAYADEPIMITLSAHMHYAVFDGKWTFTEEWKQSSFNNFAYDDGTQIALRSAHEGNFIYILVDDITDTNYQKGSDQAMICFDTNTVRPLIPNSNDSCFVDVLGRAEPFTLQGGSPMGLGGNFKRIGNPDGLVGISAPSDSNDRYSTIPHASYEFRIPTDMLGRLDHYGFYMQVFDNNKFYTYPTNSTPGNVFEVPSPKSWGDLISPDQSLPEFPWPALALSAMIIPLVMAKIGKKLSVN